MNYYHLSTDPRGFLYLLLQVFIEKKCHTYTNKLVE